MLRRLGGEYLRLARRLEGEIPSEDVTPPTQPILFRDRFLERHTEGPEMVWLPGGTFQMGDENGTVTKNPSTKSVSVISRSANTPSPLRNTMRFAKPPAGRNRVMKAGAGNAGR